MTTNSPRVGMLAAAQVAEHLRKCGVKADYKLTDRGYVDDDGFPFTEPGVAVVRRPTRRRLFGTDVEGGLLAYPILDASGTPPPSLGYDNDDEWLQRVIRALVMLAPVETRRGEPFLKIREPGDRTHDVAVARGRGTRHRPGAWSWPSSRDRRD